MKAVFVSATMLLGSAWLAFASEEQVEVRVKNTAGGPQIQLDGTSIPPRFFWGQESMQCIAVKTVMVWEEKAIDFTPLSDAPNGTMHFRFSAKKSTVFIKDVRLVCDNDKKDLLPLGSFASNEAFRKSWSIWKENTIGSVAFKDGMLVVSMNGKSGEDFHIYAHPIHFEKGKNYRWIFSVKSDMAQSLFPEVYRIDGGQYSAISTSGASVFLSQVALARDAGVRLVSFSAPNCWTEPGKAEEWTPLDYLCKKIIAVHPNVLLVPRFSANAPQWWINRHPEARMVYDNVLTSTVSCVSSRAYRAVTCEHLEKLSRHLCETFPRNFAGIHPDGQNTGEWFYYDSWKQPISGYDRCTRDAFRDWLRAHGEKDADTALVPSPEARRAHAKGFLRNPVTEKRVVDFMRFQQEEMADAVAAFAAACRRGTAGRKLVVFFYGYAFEFPPLSNGASTSGHYAMARLLTHAKDLDILCSPLSYTDREWLGTSPIMSAAETVMRAGVLWLCEDDSRTFLDTRTAEHVQEGGLVDLLQSQQVLLRNNAQEAMRGFGSWWMDLPGQGWFNDARLWDVNKKMANVDAAMAQRMEPFKPEIAAIVDEESMLYLTADSASAACPLIDFGRADFGRCGAPYGQYLLSDVLANGLDAKLQVFLSAWCLAPEQRARLAVQRTEGKPAVRVWCWAPGLLSASGVDVDGMQALTGFAAIAKKLPNTVVTATETGKTNGLSASWGLNHPVQPIFSVVAQDSETWARYSDGSPAVAVRASKTGTDVFLGVPQLTPELLHALAKLAGVHLYSDPGVSIWAANGFLSVQTYTNNPVALDTGSSASIKDALYNVNVGSGPRVTIPMRQGEVRVFRIR